MDMHERHAPVEMARQELLERLADIRQKYQLTLPEEMSLLAEEIARRMHLCVRSERRES